MLLPSWCYLGGMITIVDTAYAAGFFDGEGHVTIRRVKRTYGTYHAVAINVAQKDSAPAILVV